MQTNVLEWLVESSRKFGNKLAICDDREEMTYQQYHHKAIGLARAILDSGLDAREPVVVYLEKSVKVLAAFMGIAYAGDFYSPVDIEMPKQRINRILEILEPKLVITSKELRAEFESFNYQGDYILYEDVKPVAADLDVEKRKQQIIDTDLLYVLFTSGSTGIPKDRKSVV